MNKDVHNILSLSVFFFPFRSFSDLCLFLLTVRQVYTLIDCSIDMTPGVSCGGGVCYNVSINRQQWGCRHHTVAVRRRHPRITTPVSAAAARRHVRRQSWICQHPAFRPWAPALPVDQVGKVTLFIVALLSQRGRAMLRVCQQLASIVQYVERNLLLLACPLPLRLQIYQSVSQSVELLTGHGS